MSRRELADEDDSERLAAYYDAAYAAGQYKNIPENTIQTRFEQQLEPAAQTPQITEKEARKLLRAIERDKARKLDAAKAALERQQAEAHQAFLTAMRPQKQPTRNAPAVPRTAGAHWRIETQHVWPSRPIRLRPYDAPPRQVRT